jgi:hypothetical protein
MKYGRFYEMPNNDKTSRGDEAFLRFLFFSIGLTMIFLSVFLISARIIINWDGFGLWVMLVLLGGISFSCLAWEDEAWIPTQ